MEDKCSVDTKVRNTDKLQIFAVRVSDIICISLLDPHIHLRRENHRNTYTSDMLLC